jgi:hypothetical protein
VHGVLYKLRAEDMDVIARKEAGYVLKDVEVRRVAALDALYLGATSPLLCLWRS